MHEKIREELNTMKSRLRDRVDKLDLQRLEGKRPPLNANGEEQAQQLENEEVVEGLDEAALEQMAQIDVALAAIKAGTYGICVDCELPIAPARLQAVPFATRCIACANTAQS